PWPRRTTGEACVLDESKPLYLAVAEQIEDGILDGTHPEDTAVPSTNELAAFLRINPATAGKGLNLLADAGVLVKRRGVGMLVAPAATARLRQRRRDDFARASLVPPMREAAHLGIEPRELIEMMEALRGTPSRPETSASTSETSPLSRTSPSISPKGGCTDCTAATAPASPSS